MRTKNKTKRAGTRRSPRARAGRPATRAKKGLARIAELMAGIDYCMMTTHGARGTFHTRPMSNNGEVEFDGDSWFFTSKDTVKVDELERDEAVGLSFVGGTKGSPIWIAVTGKVEIVDDVDAKKEHWVEELEQWFEDGPEDPKVVLLHVKAKHASYWTYEEQGEVDLE